TSYAQHEFAGPRATLRVLDIDSRQVVLQVASTAAGLEPGAAPLSAEIYQLIEREIPSLHVDRRLSDLLEASVAENVDTVLHIRRHGIDVAEVPPPAAAAEHARRLAQLDVPAAPLIRAYRIGQARFLARCIEQLLQLTEGEHLEGLATQRMLERVSD